MTDEEYVKRVFDIAKQQASKPFKPFWFYNADGDQVEAFWSSEEYYAKWINNEITLYLSKETNEVIGCCLDRMKDKTGLEYTLTQEDKTFMKTVINDLRGSLMPKNIKLQELLKKLTKE